ncbi:hypothetical protein TNCV_5110511 [Trichonephila clavipes]|nr:hypothetical protein TNCV_5110511 [Trichonephila clavipes]
MLNLKRGKGFQKSAANPLLKTLLEGRKIRAVHFRSLSSREGKSVLSSWSVKEASKYQLRQVGEEIKKDILRKLKGGGGVKRKKQSSRRQTKRKKSCEKDVFTDL